MCLESQYFFLRKLSNFDSVTYTLAIRGNWIKEIVLVSSCYKVDLDLFPIRYFSVEGTSLEHAIRVILFNLLNLASS